MMRVLATLALTICSSPVLAHGISEYDRRQMIDGGYLQYIWLGASHMLTGYDHLLFLFGVVFFLTNLRDITKFVTAFTIGHSITLILATFLGITANYFLVDAVIALSVIYKGFDNNGGFRKYLDMESPNLVSVVFAFGLIHGFGLSTRLQQLPLGEDATGIFLRIISFNIGVEIGQIAALVVMVAFLSTWRRSSALRFKRFSVISNNALIVAGLMLFYMQTHGYWHAIMAEEFAFPLKQHEHVHEDIELNQESQESSHDSL